MSKNVSANEAILRKEKRNSILITISVILVAVLVIGLVVYNSLSTSGFIARRQVAVSSENYTVNGSMMTYFFNQYYNQSASQYTAYGLNTQYTLKSQVLDQSTGMTWFDFFASSTKSYVQEMLALCEAAKANNITLSEEDYAEIDKTMEDMRSAAETYGYTLKNYMLAIFGSTVNEDDVIDCLELNLLASKYMSSFNEGLVYTDADYEAYLGENTSSYSCVDFITYTVKQSDFMEVDEDGNPLGDITKVAELAKEQADLIAAAESEEAFRAALQNYFVTTLNMTEEDAAAKVDACYVTGATATEGNAASDWAFTAKTGDTNVITSTTSTSYEVYYILKSAYIDNEPTRNVRHILLTADTYGDDTEKKAQELYAMWEESGFNMDTFASLCAQYSEDPGSSTAEGLYENVAKGDMVTEFNDWLFDEARVEGDNGLIETSYGWHIMYYDGEGIPAWKNDADNALRQEAYQKVVDEYVGSIEFNDKVLYAINA